MMWGGKMLTKVIKQLMGLYVIIALAFWASPADALHKLSTIF